MLLNARGPVKSVTACGRHNPAEAIGMLRVGFWLLTDRLLVQQFSQRPQLKIQIFRLEIERAGEFMDFLL